jgi:hypothetical protein
VTAELRQKAKADSDQTLGTVNLVLKYRDQHHGSVTARARIRGYPDNPVIAAAGSVILPRHHVVAALLAEAADFSRSGVKALDRGRSMQLADSLVTARCQPVDAEADLGVAAAAATLQAGKVSILVPNGG